MGVAAALFVRDMQAAVGRFRRFEQCMVTTVVTSIFCMKFENEKCLKPLMMQPVQQGAKSISFRGCEIPGTLRCKLKTLLKCKEYC